MNRFEFYSNLMNFKNKELTHYGTKGQKWGVRHWQNADGTFNEAGKERYFGKIGSTNKKNNSDGTYKKNYRGYECYNMANNLDKYSVEELEHKANKLEDEYFKIRDEIDKYENDVIKEMSKQFKKETNGEYNNSRMNNDLMNDYLYVKTKNAEKFNEENGNDWNPDIFIDNYFSQEGEAFEKGHTFGENAEKYEELWDKYRKAEGDDRKKMYEIQNIEQWETRLNDIYGEKEIIENTEKELKKNNYKIDEKEKMNWAKKEDPEWFLDKYKDENGKEHIGLEKEFNTDYGKVKVKIHDTGAPSTRYRVSEANDTVKRLKEADEYTKNKLLNYICNNRMYMFKPAFDKNYYPTSSDKVIKYVLKMDKDQFRKEVEKQIMPKLNLKLDDTITYDKNNYNFNGKYVIDGYDKKLDATFNDYGMGNIKSIDWRDFPLDDLLD